jgi:hypothetical protein
MIPGLSTHHAHAERRALVGNDRRQHHLNRGVVEQFLLAARDLGLWVPLAEFREQVRFLRVDGDHLAAAADDRVAHAVDVRVIDAANRKAQARLLSGLHRGTRRGVGRARRDRGRRETDAGRAGHGLFEESPSIEVLRAHDHLAC